MTGQELRDILKETVGLLEANAQLIGVERLEKLKNIVSDAERSPQVRGFLMQILGISQTEVDNGFAIAHKLLETEDKLINGVLGTNLMRICVSLQHRPIVLAMIAKLL